MSFKKCLHHSAPLEYSVKFEILVQRHDYSQSSKRTEVLASRIVSGPLIPDTEYELPIKAESGLIGHAFVKLERVC